MKRWQYGVWALSLSVFLSACSDVQTRYYKRGGRQKNAKAIVCATSRPYQIKGVWYYPQQHYEYEEVGLASWYGPGFHKKPTATGEAFDMNVVSAAHKTLPLPCIALVTNLETGRMLKVKVNDRGPFVKDRIIDLSKRAADLLGILNKGVGKVRVETLVEESVALNNALNGSQRGSGGQGDYLGPLVLQAAPQEKLQVQPLVRKDIVSYKEQRRVQLAPFAEKPYSQAVQRQSSKMSTPKVQKVYLQLGVFARKANATGDVNRLKSVGKIVIQQIGTSTRASSHALQRPLYSVRMGPFESLEQARRMQQHVSKMGWKDAQIVTY